MQNSTLSPFQVFHMVMAVIGPETLDYLGAHLTHVLEECKAATGISFNISKHDYCVLKGELEAIKGAYMIINQFMENMMKTHQPYIPCSSGIQSSAVTGSASMTEKVDAVGEAEGLKYPQKGDYLIQSPSVGDIMKPTTERESKTAADPEEPSSILNQITLDSVAEPTIIDMNMDHVPDNSSGCQILLKNEGFKNNEKVCEEMVINSGNVPAGEKPEAIQPNGYVGLSGDSVLNTTWEHSHDVNVLMGLDKIGGCTMSMSVTETSTGDLITVSELSTDPETVVNKVRHSVGPVAQMKLGQKPAHLHQSSDYQCKETPQTDFTTTTARTWNLRRKRSTYRDYQSRMDALVKPWTKRGEDGSIGDNEMVLKEEVSDEEYGESSRKSYMDDTTYEPDGKLAKLDLEGKDRSNVVKRKRGRPRKIPLKRDDVVFLAPKPGNDPQTAVEDEAKAEIVFDMKIPLVEDNDVAVSGHVDRNPKGDTDNTEAEVVVDTQTLFSEGKCVAVANSGTSASGNSLLGDIISKLVENVPESKCSDDTFEASDDTKMDATSSALALALIGKKTSASEFSAANKGNKVDSLENKSNVDLDVIKDDETGDIKLSLSVSFPKLNIKLVRRANRRQIVKNNKKYTCEFCGVFFKRCGELTRHRLVVHNMNRAPRVKTVCDICGKEMRQKHLKAHIAAVHKNEKPWECNVCQKTFSTHSYLNYHLSTHKGAEERARPHLCSICGRGFYKISQLQDHHNAHTGSRPYKCSICNKTFPYRSAIGKHMIVHSQSKPYECHICHKMFKSKDYLRNHHITHEPQTYPCPGCKRIYSYRHSLLIHSRRCPGAEGNPQSELDVDLPINQRYMCGYCQEIFYDLETVQEHLTQHVQQETTTAEELMQSLAGAEPVTEEQAATIQLETCTVITQNDVCIIEEDGLDPESTVIVQDGLVPESTVFVQEDGTPVLVQAEAVYCDGVQAESVLVSNQDQVALPESANIPVTVTAEIQTSEGAVLEVPVVLQSSQA
jgi:hypothetical protein